MNLEVINVEIILTYSIPFIIALVLLFPKKYVDHFFMERALKKKRELWLNVLKKDDIVEKCTNRFKSIKYEEYENTILLVPFGAFFGSLHFAVILLILIYILDFEGLVAIAYSTSIAAVSIFVLMLLFGNYVYKKRNKNQLLEHDISISKTFAVIHWGFVTTVLYAVFLNAMYLKNQNIPNNLDLSNFYMIAAALFTSAPFNLRSIKNDFLEALKIQLNNAYVNKFPNVTVRADGNICLEGKIVNVFDEDVIFLEKENTLISTLWDSIKMVEIKKDNDEVKDTAEL